MKTARYIYDKSTGYNIFTSFDQSPIDPELTKLTNRSAIAELPEQKDVQQKIAEQSILYRRYRELQNSRSFVAGTIFAAKNDLKKAIDRGADQQSIAAIQITIQQAEQKQASLTVQIEELKALIATKNQVIQATNKTGQEATETFLKANAVYSPPRRGEAIVTEAKAAQIQAELVNMGDHKIVLDLAVESKTVFVDTEGKEVKADFPKVTGHFKIDDLRGKHFFYPVNGKWVMSSKIQEVGVPKSDVVPIEYMTLAKEAKDCAPEELEEIRVDMLTTEQKQVEKNQVLSSLLSQAAAKKSELEILGDSEALSKSQAWYNEQKQVVELKYN